MGAASKDLNDWKDGFLFVANQLILDLLNTRPVLANGPTELLPDFAALERWLIASGMVSSSKGKAALRNWRNSTQAEAFLQQLILFREHLRDAVLRIESGRLPSDAFVSEVNFLLIQYPTHTLLSKGGNRIVREAVVELKEPADLWTQVADATANLLVATVPSRVRKCESCVLHFFDTSKKGSRRWCSMNICGNKLKVAAYQRRKRTGSKSDI